LNLGFSSKAPFRSAAPANTLAAKPGQSCSYQIKILLLIAMKPELHILQRQKKKQTLALLLLHGKKNNFGKSKVSSLRLLKPLLYLRSQVLERSVLVDLGYIFIRIIAINTLRPRLIPRAAQALKLLRLHQAPQPHRPQL
jgi:hypothetical protein